MIPAKSNLKKQWVSWACLQNTGDGLLKEHGYMDDGETAEESQNQTVIN